MSSLRTVGAKPSAMRPQSAAPLCAFLIALSPVVVSTACSTLPRDPEKTLERVQRQRSMRVGLVENPPWVVRTAREPAGAEVELARRFAASLGATAEWFWGAEQPHMQALEHFQLDMVIAGLHTTTPWGKKIGLTRPYFEERIVIGVPPGVQIPETMRGLSVAVNGGDVAVASLIKKKANPQAVPDISHASGPAAAPAWELQKFGFRLTRFQLLTKEHVIAVPPGENAWLKRLEEFLQQEKANVKTLLQTNEAQP
jgi:polar amino acid transport system substrate-binding protein